MASDEISTYVAIGSLRSTASASAMQSAYKIEVRFLGGLTTTQQNAFKRAADRWSRVIVGDLPSVRVDGEVIDDLVIDADGVSIDGPQGVLGGAAPTVLRPASAGASALLPAKGMMSFDSADLAAMEADGTLVDVIAHEMGHVIGVGSIWDMKGYVLDSGTDDPSFTGAHAMQAYGELTGTDRSSPVPIENEGGPGTRESHWRETIFGNELMSGFIAAPDNPLSALTVASLHDLGYAVDMAAAEPYRLPSRAAGTRYIVSDAAVHRHTRPMPAPTVLPDDSLLAG